MKSALGVLAVLSIFGLTADNLNFDSLRPGPLPSEAWTVESTHGGGNSRWEVQADPSAPSRPNVLNQATGSTGEYEFPLAVFNRNVCRDGDLSVKFRINGGRRAQTAGLIWRYQDVNNYYLVHFSADQDNIVLYRVRDGKPTPLPITGATRGETGVHHELNVGEWYVAKVVFRGNRIRVFFGNRHLFDAEDDSLLTAGRAGVWTRGHTRASFDDFRIDKKG